MKRYLIKFRDNWLRNFPEHGKNIGAAKYEKEDLYMHENNLHVYSYLHGMSMPKLVTGD